MTHLAVIGAGAMGRNHVRVLRDILGEDLVAICDSDRGAADAVARLYGMRAYASHAELFARERPEAVVVAVPTTAHHAVVSEALAAGCHVLVEKPIAATVKEAEDLARRAVTSGLVLAVGHVERYNPAVVELRRCLPELGRVIQLCARRLGPFPRRVRDVGVVIDLATHDIDLMRMLTNSEPRRVYAETKREVHTSREDLLAAMLRFGDDSIGLLEINWLTPTKVRDLTVTGERGMFRVDYLTQDLYFFENAELTDAAWGPLGVLRGVSEGRMIRYSFPKFEPLRAELQAFVDAVRGQSAPLVSAQDGIAALRLAIALVQSAEQRRPIELVPA